MEMKQRGFTLIEIIIYFALSVAALGILTSLVTVLRRTGDHTYAQYLVSGNMATTIRLIQKELQATALASVTVYGGEAGGQSGFSCVSAYDDKGQFKIGLYGVPYWQKHVYYLLGADGKIKRLTSDIADKNHLPVAAPKPSASLTKEKVLMPDALPVNKAVDKWQPATPYGGLEVGFVRRNGATESISADNPRLSNKPKENTRLIQVIVRLLEESGPNFLEVKFRVAPKY